MITEQTAIPIGIACALFLFGVGVIRWLDSKFNRIENAINLALTDRWTKTDHRIWALELGMLNKEMRLPDMSHSDIQQGFAFTKE